MITVGAFHGAALGYAFDPGHALNGFLYVFYTGANDFNRLSRLTVDPRDRSILEEVVLIDRIPSSDAGRNGGAMAFGDDGHLYVATGDAGQPGQAQSFASLSGKVIRFSLDSRLCEIWVRGLRDPRHFDFDHAGRLSVTDRGADGVDRSHLVVRGANVRDAATLLSRVRRPLVTDDPVKWTRH